MRPVSGLRPLSLGIRTGKAGLALYNRYRGHPVMPVAVGGCSMPVSEQTTQILVDLGNGDRSAAKRLMPLVYDELRGLAGRYMQQERADHTLQATAIVHEAYLRLIDQSRVDWRAGRTSSQWRRR